MDSYEKDKKKDNDKVDQGRKPAENISSEPITNDFGTVSKEIDQIIGDTVQSHNTKDRIESKNMQKVQYNYIQDGEDTQFEKNKTDNFIYRNSNHFKEDDNKDDDLFEIKSDLNENNIINQSEQTPSLIKEDNQKIKGMKHKKNFSIPKIKWNKKQSKSFIDDKNKECFSDTKIKKKGFFSKEQTEKTSTKKSNIHRPSPKKDFIIKNTNKSDKKSFNIFSKKKNIQMQSETIKQKQFHDSTDEEVSEATIFQNNNFVQSMSQQHGPIDKDILRLLVITDDLLGKLPEDVINEFASSEDFELYKKVMNRYQIGK